MLLWGGALSRKLVGGGKFLEGAASGGLRPYPAGLCNAAGRLACMPLTSFALLLKMGSLLGSYALRADT